MPKINEIQGNIVSLKGRFPYEQEQIFNLSKETKGYLISASEDKASLLVIGDPSKIKNKVEATVDSSKFEDIEVYENYFGSIISPFGNLLKSIHKTKGKSLGKQKMDANAPNLLDRVKLSKQLKTGIITIDTMIPIGKGQRELIIGDRNTGKSTIAINAIINQKNENVQNIYVSVGQKRNSIINSYEILKKMAVLKNTIIIFANPDSSSEQFFAPKIGMAMAEILAFKGQDVLIVIDDLTKHANVYREIALSIGKSPGREAYPTDIFYQHAKLLERAGNFNEKYKNGSITCLPIVETIQEDVASLIPSNIISMTDGQIFTSLDMFNNGEFPAINVSLSISRIGSLVQSNLLKKASKNLRAQYSKLLDIKNFSEISIDISEKLKQKIKNLDAMNNILFQFSNITYSEYQIIILIELFKMKVMSELKDKIKFSIAFNKYCKNDKGAQKIIAKFKNKQYKNDYESIKKDIKIVFLPLVKIASNIQNDIITITKYKKLKENI